MDLLTDATPTPLTLILAHDQEVVQEGLAALCGAHPEISVTGRCDDGRQALEMILIRKPGFAVLGLDTRTLPALEIVRRLREAESTTKVVVLATCRDLAIVQELFQNGANGYALQDGPAQQIFEALRCVADGGRYLTPLLQVETANDPLRTLSGREREVFLQLVEGVRAKDIATALAISPKTVDTYRANIMRKLETEGLANLVRFAIRHNLQRSISGAGAHGKTKAMTATGCSD